MLTTADNPVDGLLTIAELARQKGVSKQAISKRVGRLTDIGQIQTRAGPRGTVLVNLAEYDRAVGETTEFAHVQAKSAPTASAVEHSYTEAQAREKTYQAELRRLDLDERLGKLIPVDKLAEAGARVAEAMVRAIDGLTARADEIAASVARDGVNGARATLRIVTRELRETLARELGALADSSQKAHDETDD